MKLADFNIYTALVHYPVLNKKGEIVTTSITNLDVHDIARVSKTVGIKEYFIVSPVKEQLALLDRMIGHWHKYDKLKTTDRADALSIVSGAKSLEFVINKLKDKHGELVVATTSAKPKKETVSINDFASSMENDLAYLIIFGTGWGLSDDIIDESDILLEPLEYDTGFNHLSVRSAVSIILDRLSQSLGKRV